MNAPAFRVTSPLTLRLLRRILFLSIVFILAVAGLRAGWEYRASLEDTGKVMDGIERSMARPLSDSLWDVDMRQINALLDGIRSAPGVNYAAVREADQLVAEAGVRKNSDVLVREVPLVHVQDGRTAPHGSLLLQADLAHARQQAFEAALLSMSFNAGLVLLVSLAVFLLTRGMVSRHLAVAAQHFHSLDLSAQGLSLPPLRLDKQPGGDELDILCLAVNHMQENLERAMQQAWTAEHEARSQARFPQENPFPVLRVSPEGSVIFANKASQDFLTSLGAGLQKHLPAEHHEVVRAALASGQMQQFETAFDGRTFAFVARPLVAENYVNIYGMDITERKLAADAVQRSLTEKEIMLKEIHHRVKNNLQIISSLLFLQMEYVLDPRDKELFSESQKRIQAMALVHEELYGTQNLSSVDMREYIPRLVERALASANIPVQADCRVDEVYLPVTRCIPCGLALNELVMNAVKHAFRPGLTPEDQGRLTVELRRRAATPQERTAGLHRWNPDGPSGPEETGETTPGAMLLELSVSDNGPGVPPDFDLEAAGTLGLTLVTSLTQQLSGVVTAENLAPGALFRMLFPEVEA